MALDSLSLTFTSQINWTASKNQLGLANPITSGNTPSKSITWRSTVAPAAANGADEGYALLLSIAASGNATIDLTGFADLVGQSGASLARLKFYHFRLLSASETAPDGTAGTACSAVKVGNAGGTGTNGHTLNLASATDTLTINNGAVLEYGDPGATGMAVDGTHKLLYFVNQDASNAAKLLVILAGGTA